MCMWHIMYEKAMIIIQSGANAYHSKEHTTSNSTAVQFNISAARRVKNSNFCANRMPSINVRCTRAVKFRS